MELRFHWALIVLGIVAGDRCRVLDFAFTEPNALDSVIDRELQAAVASLELLKGFYKSKTEKKAPITMTEQNFCADWR